MAEYDNLCMNCMADIGDNTQCPYCGCHRDKPQLENAAPVKSVLKKRYIIGYAKKTNGEGFTYIGYDTALDMPVELHEFFPQSLSRRIAGTADISITGGSEIIFNECLTKFISYSRKIAQLKDLPAITHIYDIFEENHTAYTVSEWTNHITLRHFVEHNGGKISWNTVYHFFMPVLSALIAMHAHGVSHLGISPDTLLVTGDGKMELSGFSIDAVRRADTHLPPDLVHGCAAIEQYITDYTPNESTDVYGFAASMLFALTGKLPPDAIKRRANERLTISNSLLRKIPKHAVTAIANALQVSPEKRTQTFGRLRNELSPDYDKSEAQDSYSTDRAKKAGKKKKNDVPNFVWVLSSCLVMLAIFTAIGFFWVKHFSSGSSGQNLTADATVSATDSSNISESGGSEIESGSNLILTPNLVGQNYSKLVSSSSNLSENGNYQIMISSKQFSDTIPEGCIISQNPEPNTKMTKGTAIVVVVSEGTAVRALPKISGKTLSEASAIVTSEGFVPSKTEMYSDNVPKGKVIGYKDVQEGQEKAYGSSVVIVVSKGPETSETSSS